MNKKLAVLMFTAFVDMMGGAIVFPQMPFLAKAVIGHGPLWSFLDSVGLGGTGFSLALLITMFAGAQLISAPYWGRVSDRIGRRPALMIGLGASAIAYLVFAFAHSLELLVLWPPRAGRRRRNDRCGASVCRRRDTPAGSREGARMDSAATNTGVAMGPSIGIFMLGFGVSASALAAEPLLRFRGPGLAAALIAALNMAFAWFYLKESHDAAAAKASGKKVRPSFEAVRRVISHSGEPASRLIWIYGITMGAFME